MFSSESLDDKIRKLAKSSFWQNLYKAAKECSNIQLFENTNKFSGLQVRFLYYLAVYNLLYEELTKYEDSYLTINVINDDIRCDAYLMYRNKKHDYLWKKYRREEKLTEHKTRHKNKHQSGDAELIDVKLLRG